MAYEVYLKKMLLPIAPSKIQTKINGQNKTITLINEGEVNLLKKAGLTDISFDCLLPNVEYPFANYKDGFEPAENFLNELEDLKTSDESFQFIVNRELPNGTPLFDTNIKVSLEDYTIKEDAKEGFDVVVSVSLKQFRDYGTKTCEIKKPTKDEPSKVDIKNNRPSKNETKNKTYKVKKGDCLWNIAKKFYGDGSLWKLIWDANKSKIKNPNLIYPNQVFTIPSKNQRSKTVVKKK